MGTSAWYIALFLESERNDRCFAGSPNSRFQRHATVTAVTYVLTRAFIQRTAGEEILAIGGFYSPSALRLAHAHAARGGTILRYKKLNRTREGSDPHPSQQQLFLCVPKMFRHKRFPTRPPDPETPCPITLRRQCSDAAGHAHEDIQSSQALCACHAGPI